MIERQTQEQDFSEILYRELHSDPAGQGGNRRAHEGYVFKCRHCGKKARDMYGVELPRISYGYDESCALNSELVKDE
jgi:hypothetical protein